jgi:hypothetical protein
VLQARRIALPVLTMMLFAVGVLHSPSAARGDFVSNTASVSAVFGDDVHTSTLNPYPLVPVSSITYAGHPELNGQCAWINSGLNAFIAANPANGTGPSGQGWSYAWAGVAQEAAVERGLSLVSFTYNGKTYSGYNPFVVNQPPVTTANGATYPSRISNAEVGGAILNLRYTPQQGAPAIANLHWIQGYTGSIYGTAFGPILDNDPAHPYSAQSDVTPFYGGPPGPYAAGTLANGGGWFLDRPFVTETRAGGEYESNPVVSSQFQVVLVGDTVTRQPLGPGGRMVTENALTLYGGEWWGYTYTAVETPEPASGLLLALGGGGLLFLRRMRVWMHAV